MSWVEDFGRYVGELRHELRYIMRGAEVMRERYGWPDPESEEHFKKARELLSRTFEET